MFNRSASRLQPHATVSADLSPLLQWMSEQDRLAFHGVAPESSAGGYGPFEPTIPGKRLRQIEQRHTEFCSHSATQLLGRLADDDFQGWPNMRVQQVSPVRRSI